ncbi:MAG: exodeoxyribonuclease VII large subunit [Hyphomicrobiaceae bacterium]
MPHWWQKHLPLRRQPTDIIADSGVLDWSPETEEEAPLAVSELVSYLSETLSTAFSAVLVMGEITNWSQPSSGHRYFTLTDGEASIDCAMWRGPASRLAFRPQAGDEVVCRGAVKIYERQGRMQLYVTAMKPIGAGAAGRAFEELKKKLTAEGLFEEANKRPLPYLPDTIGVVTSRSGAALHDILRTVALRFPASHVVLAPATVQGADAPRSIIQALRLMADYGGADVVIVGRGGGAAEDLAAFNDEAVVRAISDFPVPVISAVGHEVDVSLADLAADHRAATPTAAAEAAVPVHAELTETLAAVHSRLNSAAGRLLERSRERVTALGRALRDPAHHVVRTRQGLDQTSVRLERALLARHRLAARQTADLRTRLVSAARVRSEDLKLRLRDLERRNELGVRRRSELAVRQATQLESKLAALSPLAVLERGYSLVRKAAGDVVVRDARELSNGEELQLRFRRGSARATVVATEEES